MFWKGRTGFVVLSFRSGCFFNFQFLQVDGRNVGTQLSVPKNLQACPRSLAWRSSIKHAVLRNRHFFWRFLEQSFSPGGKKHFVALYLWSPVVVTLYRKVLKVEGVCVLLVTGHGRYHALDARCGHRGGPLEEGWAKWLHGLHELHAFNG